MIGLLPTTTIFLATAPTDLRKAYDGLAVLVRQSLARCRLWSVAPMLLPVRLQAKRPRPAAT